MKSPTAAPRNQQKARPKREITSKLLVEAVLVVLLAMIAARLFWLIIAPLPLPQGDPLEIAKIAATPQEATPSQSPFGAALSDAPAEQAIVADVAETTLNLKLKGVWTDAEAPSAAIQLPDGKQARFAVGDEIISGVSLLSVEADRAIIRRAGQREALIFEGKAAVPRNEAPSSAEAGEAAVETPSNELRSGSGLSNGGGAPLPGGLSSVIRIAPGQIGPDGAPSIRLYASENREAFQELGLRDGDRVVSIDGATMPANPAQLAAMIGSLQSKSSAVLMVERSGEQISVTVSMADFVEN